MFGRRTSLSVVITARNEEGNLKECVRIRVPMYIQPRQFGTSSAGSLKNVFGICRTLAVLVWDVNIRRRPFR